MIAADRCNRLHAAEYRIWAALFAAKYHARRLLGMPQTPYHERLDRQAAWTSLCEALYWRTIRAELAEGTVGK